MEERRQSPRTPTTLPVTVEAGNQTWKGTVINFSPEGALLALEGPWDGARDLVIRLDPELTWEGFTTEARLVRASDSDDGVTLLAVRF